MRPVADFNRLDKLALSAPEFMGGRHFFVSTPDKRPFQPNGCAGRPGHIDTCSTYEECKAACLRSKKFDSVGIMMFDPERTDILPAPSKKYGVLDIDHGRNADTGEWTATAAQLIEDFKAAFPELSVSKTGGHFYFEYDERPAIMRALDKFVKDKTGELVIKRKNNIKVVMPDGTGIEIYLGGRYMKMTGWSIPGLSGVDRPGNCQEALNKWANKLLSTGDISADIFASKQARNANAGDNDLLAANVAGADISEKAAQTDPSKKKTITDRRESIISPAALSATQPVKNNLPKGGDHMRNYNTSALPLSAVMSGELSDEEIIKSLRRTPCRRYARDFFMNGDISKWQSETKSLDTTASVAECFFACCLMRVWDREVAEAVFRRSGLMQSVEYRKAGHVDDYISRTFDEAERRAADDLAAGTYDPDDEERPNRRKIAPAVELIKVFDANHWDIFQEESTNNTLALYQRAGRPRLMDVHSKDFQSRLNAEYFTRTGRIAPQNAIAQALTVLSDRGFDKPRVETYVRTARQGDKIYYNLSDEEGHVVEVSADGWRVITNSPVIFKHVEGRKALPLPDPNGDLMELRPLFRGTDEDFIKVCLWLFQTLIPGKAHFGLCINAEQDSGKTVLTKMLKSLIDPYRGDVISPLEKPEDLAAVCASMLVVAVDNISKFSKAVSDFYSRALTGAAYMARELYTNAGVITLLLRNSAIFNGIGLICRWPDLASRMLNINLRHFAPGESGSESKLMETFKAHQPRILGALLNAMAAALKHEREHPDFKINFNTRMNDVVTMWSRAELACALPFAPGTVKRILRKQTDTSANDLLESDPLLIALSSVLADRFKRHDEQLEILPRELLADMKAKIPDHDLKSVFIPTLGQQFNKWLTTYAPTFRQAGYDIERSDTRMGQGYPFIIRLVSQDLKISCDKASSPTPEATQISAAKKPPLLVRCINAETGEETSARSREKGDPASLAVEYYNIDGKAVKWLDVNGNDISPKDWPLDGIRAFNLAMSGEQQRDDHKPLVHTPRDTSHREQTRGETSPGEQTSDGHKSSAPARSDIKPVEQARDDHKSGEQTSGVTKPGETSPGERPRDDQILVLHHHPEKGRIIGCWTGRPRRADDPPTLRYEWLDEHGHVAEWYNEDHNALPVDPRRKNEPPVFPPEVIPEPPALVAERIRRQTERAKQARKEKNFTLEKEILATINGGV